LRPFQHAVLDAQLLSGREMRPALLVASEFYQLVGSSDSEVGGVELVGTVGAAEKNFPTSRNVKVACMWVSAWSAIEGSSMIRRPFSAAMAPCSATRSAKFGRKRGFPLPRGRDSDLAAGDEVDALRLEAATVNLDVQSGASEVLICDLRPLRAPVLQLLLGVPVSTFVAEAFRSHLPHGQ